MNMPAKEKKECVTMSNTVSQKPAVAREQIELIVVGRKNKVRLCSMSPSNPTKAAVNRTIDVPAGKTVRQTIMETIAAEINKASAGFSAAGKKMAMEIYTNGQVAIKYYQMVPYLKGGHFMTTEEIMALSMKKDGTMNNDTDADRGAYDDVAQALAKAFAAGHVVHMQASGTAAFMELILPEGVTVYEGDKLTFVNGVTENGIRVRNWPNGTRANAVVRIKGATAPRAYISRAEDPEKPWRSLKKLLNTINACWNDLPDDRDASQENGSEEELYA